MPVTADAGQITNPDANAPKPDIKPTKPPATYPLPYITMSNSEAGEA